MNIWNLYLNDKNYFMRKIKILFVAIFLFFSVSCDMVINDIKGRATKIIEDKKVEIDSTINKEINNTINKVDILFNHQKK